MNRCRTLFATHFHELADMLGYSKQEKGHGPFEVVSFFCTDVDETDVCSHFYSLFRVALTVNRMDILPILIDSDQG